MKKLLILVGAITALSISQASELWWTVADNATVDGNSATWDTAKFYASSTGYNYDGTQIGSDIAKTDMEDLGFWSSDISSYDSSAYSFYVELWNSESLVGRSYVSTGTPPQGATPYSSLSGAIYSTSSIMNPTAEPASFSQFTTAEVIPEPTSGVLVLLGMMALGLKRKRV